MNKSKAFKVSLPFLITIVLFVLLMLKSASCKTVVLKKLTFQVAIPEDFRKHKIGLRGNISPLSWNTDKYLKDEDGDGIYEIVVSFVRYYSKLEYKYTIEKEEIEWELSDKLNRRYMKDGNVDRWNNYVPTQPSGLTEEILNGDSLSQDFEILKKVMTDLNPSLTKYLSAEELNEAWNELEGNMQVDQKYSNLHISVAQFLAKIKCGHTHINPYNQDKKIEEGLYNRKSKLPFTVKVLKGELYINRWVGLDSELSKGDRIVAVNNVPGTEIIGQLMTVARGDGSNDGNRISRLENLGSGGPEFFDLYFPMFFPLDENAIVTVEKYGSQIVTDVEVPVMTIEERTSLFLAKYKELNQSYEDTWQFEVLSNELAYLKLGTYTIWKFEMDWKAFLKRAFDEVKAKNIPNMVIDIRGNEGGSDDVYKEMAKHMLTKDVNLNMDPSVSKYQKVSDEIKPYLKTWDNYIFDVTGYTKPYKEGYFVENDQDFKPSIYPAVANAYAGKIFYLVDATNSSATFIQAKFVKDNQLGIIVGQTTGGNYKGITGGSMFFCHLPYSKLEVDIPLFTILPKDSYPDSGVIPDIIVKHTLQAFVEGRDLEIEEVLSIIASTSI